MTENEKTTLQASVFGLFWSATANQGPGIPWKSVLWEMHVIYILCIVQIVICVVSLLGAVCQSRFRIFYKTKRMNNDPNQNNEESIGDVGTLSEGGRANFPGHFAAHQVAERCRQAKLKLTNYNNDWFNK